MGDVPTSSESAAISISRYLDSPREYALVEVRLLLCGERCTLVITIVLIFSKYEACTTRKT